MQRGKISKPKPKYTIYKYTVVQFREEDEEGKIFECIPDKWFLDETKTRCYWPPSTGSSFKLRAIRCEKPDDSWEVCKVTVISEGHLTYNSGFKALQEKCNQKYNTSSADEQIEAERYRREHPVLAMQNEDAGSIEHVFRKPNCTKEKGKLLKAGFSSKNSDSVVESKLDENATTTLIQNSDSVNGPAVSEVDLTWKDTHCIAGLNNGAVTSNGPSNDVYNSTYFAAASPSNESRSSKNGSSRSSGVDGSNLRLKRSRSGRSKPSSTNSSRFRSHTKNQRRSRSSSKSSKRSRSGRSKSSSTSSSRSRLSSKTQRRRRSSSTKSRSKRSCSSGSKSSTTNSNRSRSQRRSRSTSASSRCSHDSRRPSSQKPNKRNAMKSTSGLKQSHSKKQTDQSSRLTNLSQCVDSRPSSQTPISKSSVKLKSALNVSAGSKDGSELIAKTSNGKRKTSEAAHSSRYQSSRSHFTYGISSSSDRSCVNENVMNKKRKRQVAALSSRNHSTRSRSIQSISSSNRSHSNEFPSQSYRRSSRSRSSTVLTNTVRHNTGSPSSIRDIGRNYKQKNVRDCDNIKSKIKSQLKSRSATHGNRSSSKGQQFILSHSPSRHSISSRRSISSRDSRSSKTRFGSYGLQNDLLKTVQKLNNTIENTNQQLKESGRRMHRMELTVNKIFVLVGDLNGNMEPIDDELANDHNFEIPALPIESTNELAVMKRKLKDKEFHDFYLQHEKGFCCPTKKSTDTVTISKYLSRFISLRVRSKLTLKEGDGSTLYKDYIQVYNFLIDVMQAGYKSCKKSITRDDAHSALRIVWGRSKQYYRDEQERQQR